MGKFLLLVVSILCISISGLAQKRPAAVQTPVIILTFDDAEASHYSIVAPLLKQFNFDATFFVCEFPYKSHEDSIKHSMTWAQIRELHNMGFEIGNHTGHHKNVTKLTRDDIKKEISYIEFKCKESGVTKPISFAYPGNRADSLSQVVLKEMGYKYARVGGSKLYKPETDNPLLIPSYTVTSDDKLKDRAWRTLRELQPGDILIFTIHGVPDVVHPDYSIAPNLLTEYLQYMTDHHFKVIAMRDLEKYIEQ